MGSRQPVQGALIVMVSPRERQSALLVMSKEWGRRGGSNDIAIHSRKISHCHLLRAKKDASPFAAYETPLAFLKLF